VKQILKKHIKRWQCNTIQIGINEIKMRSRNSKRLMKPIKLSETYPRKRTMINSVLLNEIHLEEDSNNDGEVMNMLDMRIYSHNSHEVHADNEVNEGLEDSSSISEISSLADELPRKNQKHLQKKKKKYNSKVSM
jgi:hypothetical protein